MTEHVKLLHILRIAFVFFFLLLLFVVLFIVIFFVLCVFLLVVVVLLVDLLHFLFILILRILSIFLFCLIELHTARGQQIRNVFTQRYPFLLLAVVRLFSGQALRPRFAFWAKLRFRVISRI